MRSVHSVHSVQQGKPLNDLQICERRFVLRLFLTFVPVSSHFWHLNRRLRKCFPLRAIGRPSQYTLASPCRTSKAVFGLLSLSSQEKSSPSNSIKSVEIKDYRAYRCQNVESALLTLLQNLKFRCFQAVVCTHQKFGCRVARQCVGQLYRQNL